MTKSLLELTEDRYAARRAAGLDGWGGPDGVADALDAVQRALAHVPIARPSLLEIGCGSGELLAALAQAGHAVVGLDQSTHAIAWARERLERLGLDAELVVADLTALAPGPLPRADVVIDGRCTHCVLPPHRPQLFQAIRALGRGYFVLHAMCGEPGTEALAAAFDADTRLLRMPDGRPQRYIGTRSGLLDELQAAGMEILHEELRPRHHAEEFDDLLAVGRYL